MLIVVSGNSISHLHPIQVYHLRGVQAVSIQNPGQPDLKFVGTVQCECIIKPVVIVRGCDDLRNDQSPVSCQD